MLTDYINAEHTLDYLEYVDQFTSVYESDDIDIDVSQVLDSINV